jgi:hypothetical protein
MAASPPSRGRHAVALGLLAAAFAGAPPVAAGVVKVSISLPLPARLDTTGVQTILVVNYLENEHPDINLSNEVVRLLRRLLAKGTTFRVLDVPPPNLPEQNLADLIHNREYWREVGRRYGADLILSGQVDFEVVDQSGFVQEDYVSPVTGERVRRTRYAERESFGLKLDLLVLRGATGDLAYQDHYEEDALFEGKSTDHFQVLFDLVGRLEPEILGILTGHSRQETRYLLNE